MKKITKAFVLPVTLIFIAATIAIASVIYLLAAVYVPYQRTINGQEKAYQLALGGVQIACSQLGRSFEPEKKEATGGANTQPNPPPPEVQFLAHTLPILNQWQTIQLNKERDGITGSIKICISSEDGKIDLNQIYNVAQHTFANMGPIKEGWKIVMQELCTRIEKRLPATGLFAALEKFLAKRDIPLNDITELFNIPEFAVFKKNIFYQPPEKTGEKNIPIYLADIFTLFTYTPLLSPWFLSSSIMVLLEISRESIRSKSPEELMSGLLKDVKKNDSIKDLWNKILAKIYGKELQSLPKNIESMLSTTFDPKSFSIMVQATTGAARQQICAVVERVRAVPASPDKPGHYDVVIKRLYRI
jgi:hypothetical protein